MTPPQPANLPRHALVLRLNAITQHPDAGTAGPFLAPGKEVTP